MLKLTQINEIKCDVNNRKCHILGKKKLLELNKNNLQTLEFLQGHYITHESFGHHAIALQN